MKTGIMRYSNSFMTIVMLVLFLIFVGVAATYPPGARFMPFVVGFPAIGLLILQLFLDARARRLAGEQGVASEDTDADSSAARFTPRAIQMDLSHDALTASDEIVTPQEKLRREIIMWGYFLGFIAGILLFGFWLAIPVFLIAFLRERAKASWRMTLGLALPFSIGLYLVFEKFLHISPHGGFITNYVRTLFGFE
jgi:hypothetical protein